MKTSAIIRIALLIAIVAPALLGHVGAAAFGQAPLPQKQQKEFLKTNEEVGKIVQKAHKLASQRKYDKAIKTQNEAILKSLKVYRPTDEFHLNLLRTLAQITDSAGRPDESIALRQQIYDRATEAMGELDVYRLDCLYELALARHGRGEDSIAIPLIEDVLRKSTLQRVRTTQAAAAAERLYADWRMANAKNPVDSIRAELFDLKAKAALYRATNDSIDERALDNRALKMFYDSTDLFNAGHREEAIDSMRSAIDQWQLFDGPFGLSVGNAKKALGFFANSFHDYPLAIRSFHEALFIHEYLGHSDDYEYSKTMSDLSRLYFFSRDNEGTVISSKNAYESFKNLICKNFASLNGQERAEFWDMCHVYFEKTLPSFALHVPELSETCYDAVLLSKGLLLNVDTELRQFILNSNDPSLIGKLKTVRMLRRNIEDQLYLDEDKRDQRLIDMSRQSASTLEKELVEACDHDGNFTANIASSWRDVAARLQPDEVAIEFLHVPIGGWQSRGYAALVIKPGMDKPQQQFLCMEDEIDRIEPSTYYTSSDLSEEVWGPLKPYIDGCTKVYFAPAGMFYNVAIENLPAPTGHGFVSDNIDFHRLSSTRELTKERTRPAIGSAAVYGGLFYNPEQEAFVNAIPEEADSLFHIAIEAGGMSYLPATRLEADTVAARLKADPSRKVYVYTGALGSESSFKNLSGRGINLIHVATHGHYYNEDEAIFYTDFRYMNALLSSEGQDAISAEDRMLARSGLYFAGANTYSRNAYNPGILDDGILTAKEIGELDFRGLDLVVLSACETGLGDITGDGVYGLQRGFKKAGAKSILMSLWKIDDEATSMLMNDFYAYLDEGRGKYAALKQAQADLRDFTKPDGSQPYASPTYWGAFVILDALN